MNPFNGPEGAAFTVEVPDIHATDTSIMACA